MRILIADDHAVVRRGLVSVLHEQFPLAEVVEVSDAEMLYRTALEGPWDLIVSDISMPGRSGLEIIEEIKKESPQIPILALSIYPEAAYGPRALKAGASAYLNKDSSPAELKRAIALIMQGRKYITPLLAEKLAEEIGCDYDPAKAPHERLTDRELNILKLIAGGMSLLQIGGMLSISPSTVSTYRARILKKMQMRSNSELTRYCIQYGIE